MKIEIPKELADRIEKKMKETNFKSISDYIVYLIKKVTDKPKKDPEIDRYFSEKEQSVLRKHLRESGYLE